MKSKIETVIHTAPGVGDGSPTNTPEPRPAFDHEEWAWMVAEDPAFYLATGRAENTCP